MSRERRIDLLRRLEKQLESRVIVLVLGDRQAALTQLADDSIRPLYDHLIQIGKVKKLQLFLYSIGGVTETPWKLVNTIRQFCETFQVIIPYKAYSAATMISMGADKIQMTRKAELSPVDPALMIAPGAGGQLLLPDLGVEDIAAYVSFLRNRAGLTDQSALSSLMSVLAQSLTPPLLGRIERVYSHIRLVSRKLLDLCKPPLEDRVVTAIIEALTEKTYVHNHGISREEAKQIGMQVEFLEGELEQIVWGLFCLYEDELKLKETHDVESLIPDHQDALEMPKTVAAFIESTEMSHGFIGTVIVRRVRKIPAQPTLNINLQLQLPPGIAPAQIPQEIQQTVQQLMTQGVQQLQEMVRQELIRQSPVERVERKLSGGAWVLL